MEFDFIRPGVEKFFSRLSCAFRQNLVSYRQMKREAAGMQKVLIADHNEDFSLILAGALRGRFLVETCPDGARALERLRRERPDALILDLMVTGMQGLELLKIVRTEGLCGAVIVASSFYSNYVIDAIQRYQVDYAVRKPCSVQSVVDLLDDMLAGPELFVTGSPTPENVVASMLLALNVPSHRNGFRYLRMGILMCAQDPTLQVTKRVYPEIAKEFGTSKQAVEKAIRAVIDVAWQNRNESLWRQYFPAAADGRIPKPTNTQFLFRLAEAMDMGRQTAVR